MKKLLWLVVIGIVLIITGFLTGCTSINGRATRTTLTTNGWPVVDVVEFHGVTFGGGKQALESVGVSSSKTSQKAGASSLNQESTLNDLTALLEAIAKLKTP